ncbi:MAG TPA: HD domain-containing protein [Gemmataceae bacterium]|nr:HD domain-containing protein [Gemmataceae bacterium]
MDVVETVMRLFAVGGADAYFGESVSQAAHALQSAHLAEQAGADDALVVAALLHDVGHLLHGLSEDVAERGIDGRHEQGGADWLARHFGPAVSEPVRLHVAAKRYLCAVEPLYFAGLSPASRRSLDLQGGPFDADGVRAFEAGQHFRDAVRLRRWDDEAKVPGLAVPGLDHYRARLAAAARREG